MQLRKMLIMGFVAAILIQDVFGAHESSKAIKKYIVTYDDAVRRRIARRVYEVQCARLDGVRLSTFLSFLAQGNFVADSSEQRFDIDVDNVYMFTGVISTVEVARLEGVCCNCAGEVLVEKVLDDEGNVIAENQYGHAFNRLAFSREFIRKKMQ